MQTPNQAAPPSPQPSFVSVLARTGHRLTAPRRAVAELIAARQGHFTAAEILDDARAQRVRIGRATLFRALDLFTELEALERLDLPSGEHAYVACDPFGHHHHVVCSICGRSTEVDDCGMKAVTTEVGRRTGYQVESHRLELYGVCPECSAAAGRGPAA